MTAQEIKAAYPGYAGWNDEASIVADFNATGGEGKGGGYGLSSFDPNSIPVSQPTLTPSTINIDDYIRAIQDTLPEPPEEYLKANPFYFDEQSARDVSTAEFAPYYNEILQDYLSDVKLTADKNKGDATRILADLDQQKQLFLQNNSQELNKTLRGIKEGYSGKGLYFSGFTGRDTGEAQSTNTNKLEGYLNTYGTSKQSTISNNAYQQQQAQTLAGRKARDIGREQEASVAGGINTQKDEAIDEYLYGMQTYYKNPNWKSMVPATT